MSIDSSEPVPDRRERRRLETRARIRDAAATLFAEQGYEETKVADICARADVAYQTFFNHFPRKGDLLTEFFQTGVEFVRERLEEALQRGETTRERLRLFLGGLIEPTVALGPRHRELISAILGAAGDSRRGEHARQVSAAFAALVESGIARGDVTADYRPELLSALVEGSFGVLISRWADGPDTDARPDVEALASLLADALTGPRSAR